LPHPASVCPWLPLSLAQTSSLALAQTHHPSIGPQPCVGAPCTCTQERPADSGRHGGHRRLLCRAARRSWRDAQAGPAGDCAHAGDGHPPLLRGRKVPAVDGGVPKLEEFELLSWRQSTAVFMSNRTRRILFISVMHGPPAHVLLLDHCGCQAPTNWPVSLSSSAGARCRIRSQRDNGNVAGGGGRRADRQGHHHQNAQHKPGCWQRGATVRPPPSGLSVCRVQPPSYPPTCPAAYPFGYLPACLATTCRPCPKP
jgi:hypothetical protein